MPQDTGIWTAEEAADNHIMDYKLARLIRNKLETEATRHKPFVWDLGAGIGEYTDYLYHSGYQRITAVDGTSYPNTLPVPHDFHDLTTPVPHWWQRGHVICLEVGEHIPEEHLDTFLDNVCGLVATDHKLVLSWAVPGQEGIGHVSCRPNTWVIAECERRGLVYQEHATEEARESVSNYCAYFRDTLLIFGRW